MIRRFLLLLILWVPLTAGAQDNILWTQVNPDQIVALRNTSPDVQPHSFLTYHLERESLRRQLERSRNQKQAFRLPVPMPNGETKFFHIQNSRNLPPALQRKYPEVYSFSGTNPADPAETIRLSLSPLGFHAVIHSEEGEVYIDPYSREEKDHYLVYYTRNERSTQVFCEDLPIAANPEKSPRHDPIISQLRSGSEAEEMSVYQYRIAFSTTGEFSTYWGGTPEDVLSAVNVALDRVNAIFIRDAAIVFTLVENVDTLFNYDAETDPFTGNNAAAAAGENIAYINERIGFENFDIGHVLTRGCSGSVGGISLGAGGNVCSGGKAGAASCIGSSLEQFYNGILAHEIGHQFSAAHTWNNCSEEFNDQRSSSTAFEPGSGSTIMSYAGSCGGQNVAGSNDPYFHVNSIESMLRYSRINEGSTCATIVPSENLPPSVEIKAEAGLFIPINTPFKLEASGRDPDGDQLSYCWEQYDMDFFVNDIAEPQGNVPLFRSFPPTPDSVRFIPRLADLLNNRSRDSEILPDYNRDLTFRCTVRDNDAEAGGVTWEEVRFRATEQAGPFIVTSPRESRLEIPAGRGLAVTWDVANTDQAPVNCRFVNVRLSLDAGQTYPILLAENTLNDGSVEVTLPDTTVQFARIMVEAVDNIFFDLSDFNFALVPSPDTTFALQVSPAGVPLHCQPAELAYQIQTTGLNGFSEEIRLEVAGDLPAGSSVEFSANPVQPGASSTLRLNVAGIDAAEAQLELLAISDGDTLHRELFFNTLSNDFAGLEMTSPTDGQSGILLSTPFAWNGVENADSYDFEVASSPRFGPDLLEGAMDIPDTSYQPTAFLDDNELYFWRIRPVNECGPGEFLEPHTFHTASVNCVEYKDETRVNISGTGLPTVESTIEVEENGIINDLNIPFIKANYQPVNSLEIRLISPAGTEVVLFDRNCGATVNLRMGFDDDAPSEIACPPDDGIVFRPLNPLAAFIGENTQGTWTLQVTVVRSGFGASGAIEEWGLEFCSTVQPIDPVLVTKDTLFVPPGLENTITPNELLASDEDNSSFDLTYTIVKAPAHGMLSVYGTPLTVGDQFSQRAIETFDLLYRHDGSDTQRDEFTFVIEDGTGGFIPVQRMPIRIDANAVVGLEVVPEAESNLFLYPNPARDRLFVRGDWSSGAPVIFRLYNAQGQLLRSEQIRALPTAELPLQSLRSGMYILSVQHDGRISSKPFSVVRD